MSKQQDIIDAIIARIETISKTSGYQTDIGGTVREWDVVPDDETELPVVDVREVDVEISRQGATIYDMPVEIRITASGSTAAAEARKMVFDVYKAIGTDPRFSGLASNTYQESHSIDIAQGDIRTCRATVNILVKFITAPWGAE